MRCRAGFSAPAAETLAALTGEAVPALADKRPPIADAIVLLRHSRRFQGDGGIGRLARLINDGEAEAALALLEGDGDPELGWHRVPDYKALAAALPARAVTEYRPYLQAVREGREPAEVFAAFAGFRVLCAHRSGRSGVEGLNTLIETALAECGFIQREGPWYAGRPLMIAENDYSLRLFNGDIGLVLPDPEAGGAKRVFFRAPTARSGAFTQGGCRLMKPCTR
ncbi:hypothetical protein [Alkalilimnicola ehrlichii]|uniref:hypothetical protein n=1 Tax=Alkalilimnicola ehrlichii TaxID=351052 RepID=UPI000E2EC887|nr:hypothetical protein [Alkalilimnicola ehrlichii]